MRSAHFGGCRVIVDKESGIFSLSKSYPISITLSLSLSRLSPLHYTYPFPPFSSSLSLSISLSPSLSVFLYLSPLHTARTVKFLPFSPASLCLTWLSQKLYTVMGMFTIFLKNNVFVLYFKKIVFQFSSYILASTHDDRFDKKRWNGERHTERQWQRERERERVSE